MANVPDHNDPTIHESEVKVFTQKYYVVDDEGYGNRDYPYREERLEIIADDNGVFLESKDSEVKAGAGSFSATEQLSIATPQMAVRMAKYILESYADPEPEESAFAADLIKFLAPEVQVRVSHELWRLRNHCLSPHGPVDKDGAYELLDHIETIARFLDLEIKPAPPSN
jgi:hypothetical protein